MIRRQLAVGYVYRSNVPVVAAFLACHYTCVWLESSAQIHCTTRHKPAWGLVKVRGSVGVDVTINDAVPGFRRSLGTTFSKTIQTIRWRSGGRLINSRCAAISSTASSMDHELTRWSSTAEGLVGAPHLLQRVCPRPRPRVSTLAHGWRPGHPTLMHRAVRPWASLRAWLEML